MTFINEYTTYCAICGGPIQDLDVDSDWLSEVVLLHRSTSTSTEYLSTEYLSTEIQQLPAKNIGGPYFELLPNLGVVTACDKSRSICPSPRPLYIACHKKCMNLATRCMRSHEASSSQSQSKSQSKSQSHRRSVAESMQHLWLVLVNLFERASEDKFGPLCNIYNAQAYGDIWRFQELVWQPGGGGDTKTRFESMHFEADPEHLPNLTETIVFHLQPISISEICAQPPPPEEEEPSDVPPPNARLELTDALLPLYINISPDPWHKKALIDTHLPWLWDLDWSFIARKETSSSSPLPPGHRWNWTLLMSQLARVDLHEPRAVFEDLPMGLRNRRRIWKIVDDILGQKDVEGYYASQWQK